MSSNGWITDRLPTEKDVEKYPELAGNVWVMQDDKVVATYWKEVPQGVAWMPLFKPYKYAKPKRFVVKYDKGWWSLFDEENRVDIRLTAHIFGEDKRHFAQRICDIYNEVVS